MAESADPLIIALLLASIESEAGVDPEVFCVYQVDLQIGSVNSDGLRGTTAVRDMKKDQIAVHLPSQLVIPLGPGRITPEVCAAVTQLLWHLERVPHWPLDICTMQWDLGLSPSQPRFLIANPKP